MHLDEDETVASAPAKVSRPRIATRRDISLRGNKTRGCIVHCYITRRTRRIALEKFAIIPSRSPSKIVSSYEKRKVEKKKKKK